MKTILLTSVVVLATVGGAMAQQAPAAPAAKVDMSVIADMQSLKSSRNLDTFSVQLSDSQIATNMGISCQSGQALGSFTWRNRACQATGNGFVLGPNGQKLPRTQYSGGYTVEGTGFTSATSLVANYLALGKAPAETKAFGGSMNLKPQTTSVSAAQMRDFVLKHMQMGSGGLIDNRVDRVDTVDFNGISIPSAGMPSDQGCTWSGNMVFAYQTNSWYLNLSAACGGKTYALKGNMPWTDVAPGKTLYSLTLTMPGAEAATDDALFAAPAGDDALFATVNGITASIAMDQSQIVKVKVDGKDTETPAYVKATGSFNGTGVPLNVVRSLATLFALLSQTLYGA